MDWFSSFCTIFTVGGTNRNKEDEKSPLKKPRRAGRKARGSKKVFQVGHYSETYYVCCLMDSDGQLDSTDRPI